MFCNVLHVVYRLSLESKNRLPIPEFSGSYSDVGDIK